MMDLSSPLLIEHELLINLSKGDPSLAMGSSILFSLTSIPTVLKDTHREKALSNKTPALRKSTTMGVWAVGTLNQLFIRGS